MAIITVVCTGWLGVTHDPPLVLREKVGTTDSMSHSICPACEVRMMSDITKQPIAELVASRREKKRVTYWAQASELYRLITQRRLQRAATQLDFHGGEQ